MIIGSAEIEIRPTTQGFAEAAQRDIEDPAKRMAGRIKEQFADLGKTILGAFAVREVGQFFKDTVTAASDTVESLSKAAIVFGDSADQVERFAEGAEYLGLANQQALEAASGFGNLFSAMDIADAKSAEMSTSLVALAGDLAFFQNTSVEEALQALTSGIVGETEPLRKYAVTLTESRIRQEALAQGLTVGTGALDAQTKALAIYGLIMQDTVNAQGNAVLTGHELAGQQKILTAEWANAKAEIGAGLLPAALELVEATRGDLLPTVVDLAESAVPLLIAGFEAAEPLLGSTTTIIRAMAPGLEVVAKVIDSIPAPLLSMATQGYAASRAVGFLGSTVSGSSKLLDDFRLRAMYAGDAVRGVDGAAGTAASGISKLNVAVGLATVAVGVGVSIYNAATESAREYAEQVDVAADAMERVISGQTDVNTAVDEFLAKQDLSDAERSGLFAILGEDAFGQIRDAIIAGKDELDPFREAIRQTGVDLEGLDVGKLDNPPSDRGHIPRRVAEEYEIERSVLQDLIGTTEDYAEELQDGAQRVIESAILTGDLTVAQRDAALAQAGMTENGENWAAAASIIGGKVAELAGVTGDMTGANEGATGAIRDVTEALEREQEVAAGVEEALLGIAEAQIKAFSSGLDYDQAVAKFTDSLGDLAEAEQTVADVAAGRGAADEALLSSSQGLVDAERDARRSMADATDRVREAEAALADARTEFGPGSEAAIRAADALADAREDLADTERTTGRAIADAREGVADAEVSASEEAVSSLRELRDTRFDVQEAALAQADAALEAAEAEAALHGRELEANEGLRIQAQELRNTAAQMAPGSPMRVELEALASEIEDRIAKNHPITFSADTAPARVEIDRLARDLNEAFREFDIPVRLSEGGGGGLILGAAHGFSGTVNRPTQFLVGEGGEAEDVLVVPASLGGVPKVVAQLAAALQGGGPFVGGSGRPIEMVNHFHIHEATDGRSFAMKAAKRMSGAGFRGGISGLVD